MGKYFEYEISKERQNLLARESLFASRRARAARQAGWFDGESLQVALLGLGIMAVAFYAFMSVALDKVYDLLERAGVFSSIFNFMGW